MRPLQESLAALRSCHPWAEANPTCWSVYTRCMKYSIGLKAASGTGRRRVEPEVSFDEGKALLDTHTEALLWGCSQQVGTCTSW